MNKESIVIKLGGSLLYNLNLDVSVAFLARLAKWYPSAKSRYGKIVIAVGGGKIARHLVSQLEDLLTGEQNRHRIGMAATTMNAEMVKSVLGDESIVVPRTLGEGLETLVANENATLVCGGFKIGWSSDMDAAVIADVIGCKKVYKLSNIDHVYTADPSTTPGAQPIKDINWHDFLAEFKIANDAKTLPGEHTPVGPMAALFCARKGISFFVSGGKSLVESSDLSTIFESGTFIHP